MLNKKIRKLIKNPKLFFSDMNLKRSQQINALKPKKNNGNNKFTVVSAVYNVGKYLDKYFESLVNQRLDFENNIQLILVDDGSPDDSAQVIKRWQKKYPNNITYVKKENGGQASARNYGLKFVKTEWVTFIDPDDFVDINYFISIEDFINKNKESNIGILCCNFIFYFEDLEQFKDTHPLKYRFAKGDRLSGVLELKKDVQLSVNSAIFKSEIISKNNVLFGEDIKPNFEDAHFVATYLIHFSQEKVAFVKSAQYFYRKRSDGSSTLDRAWEKPSLYNIVLEKGCLDLLRRYKKEKGNIPEFIQITNLYHLIWYFKKLINNTHKLSFLSDVEKQEFLQLVDEIFEHIDVKTIMEFSLADCWFYHKVGLLGAFKHQEPANQIVYIDSYDRVKDITQIRFFSYNEPDVKIKSAGNYILPHYEKETQHDFVDRLFVREYRLWVKINPEDKLSVIINNKPAIVACGGKQYREGITGQGIRNYFSGLIPSYVEKNENSDAWIFMDRDFQADDNAEHLYRYVMREHPERNIYFTLNKDSHDWQRLESEGFRMLEFGSEQHHKILKSCSKIISSNADHCVVNLLGPRMLAGRHFVFLQHGVIHNDLSTWLNQKENIDCFVTSSPFEYQSIVGNASKYKYSSKEVVLTGLPRHDYLVNNNVKPEKIILVMPTWRSDIVGKSDLGGHSRVVNEDFLETNFAQSWISLLHSNEFKEVLEKHNYRIVIYPHPNLIPYIKYLKVSDNIEVLMPESVRIQEVFCRSALLLTDYTSVAFDMAVQDKSTIYYQFDEYEVLHSGRHTFGPGYFKHRRDGFGPVCSSEEEVIHSLDRLLENECVLDIEVAERIAKTFPLRDGRCCKRTFDAIVALDSPELPEISADRLVNQAIQMTREGNWSAAESWWKSLAQRDDVWLRQDWSGRMLEESCLNVLKENSDFEGKVPENIQSTVLYHLFLYIRPLMNNTHLLGWMDSDKKTNFLNLLDAIFFYIDDKSILKFSREGSWFLHKSGMLNAFKHHQPDCQYVYVDSYDRVKGLVQLRYFIRGGEPEIFQIGDVYALPVYEKTMRHDILEREFIQERRVWLSINPKDKLVVNISNLPTILSYGGKQYKDGVTGQSIISYFNGLRPKYIVNSECENAWLFMDQLSQAGDNAEYLYRYVMNEYPEKEIYFALNQDSPDWKRLENEGFCLLSFGSQEHLNILKSCSKVISSQSENYVTNFIGSKMLLGRHFIYLQSGVNCHNTSSLLNIKDNIDCFVTSTRQEYSAICSDNGKYKYSSKEVVLAGLPRFDYLLSSVEDRENIVLLMPSLNASQIDDGINSYLAHWNKLISSDLLKETLDVFGYKAVLYIPSELPACGGLYSSVDNVEVLTSSDIGLCDILRAAKLLLTDCSPTTFDMAIQNKSTIYYHSDDDLFLKYFGDNLSSEYFDYHKNGFGPICYNVYDAIENISTLLKNDCYPDQRTLDVIKDTFVYRDTKCCERIFTAIEALDSKNIPEISIDDMIFQATQIVDSSDWRLAVRWWRTITQDKRCWENVGFYTELLEFSCLHLLKHASSQNLYVSVTFQNAVLQHLFICFKHLMDHSTEVNCLNNTTKEICWSIIKKITQYIDDVVIMKFSGPGYWFLHKVGILGTLKNSSLESQIVYIEKVDKIKELVQLRYFSFDDEPLLVQVNDKYSCALYNKDICHDLLGHQLLKEKREWHKLPIDESVRVDFANLPTSISFGGKQHHGAVSGKSIYDYFEHLSPRYPIASNHPDVWIFMDRELYAGDNAEYLYRYVMQNFPDKNIYFALSKESPDWNRLDKEGFQLVSFGCNKHKDLLKLCSKVISSQAENYVTNLLGPKMLLGRHFVYLQHSINQNNSYYGLNKKDNIDCLITSTENEYQSIINDRSMYKYSSKEVVLTGMPRFDSLVGRHSEKAKQVLIMPITADSYDANNRLSEKWNDVITSSHLKNIMDEYGYKTVFYSNSKVHIDDDICDELEYLEFLSSENSNVQELIRNTGLLLTDSTEFSIDMAIQNKPVIYLCDKNKIDINNASHVFKDVSDVLMLLSQVLAQDCKPVYDILDIESPRLNIRDGLCCQRVFCAINDLDNPSVNDPQLCDKRINDALWFSQNGLWDNAAKVWCNILTDNNSLDYKVKYVESLLAGGNIVKTSYIAERMTEEELSLCSDEQKSTVAFMYFLLGEYEKVINIFKDLSVDALPYYYHLVLWMLGNTTSVNFDDCGKAAGEFFLYIRMLIDNKEYEMALATLSSHEGDDALCSSLTIDILYSGEMYDELDEELSSYHLFDINSALAMKYLNVLLHKERYSDVVSYDNDLFPQYTLSEIKENNEPNDFIRNIFAESYLYIKEWSSAIYHFNKTLNKTFLQSYKHAYSYRMLGNIDKSLSILENSLNTGDGQGKCKDSWLLLIELCQISGDWNKVVYGWNNIIRYFSDSLPTDAWLHLKNAQIRSKLDDSSLSDSERTLLLVNLGNWVH